MDVDLTALALAGALSLGLCRRRIRSSARGPWLSRRRLPWRMARRWVPRRIGGWAGGGLGFGGLGYGWGDQYGDYAYSYPYDYGYGGYGYRGCYWDGYGYVC